MEGGGGHGPLWILPGQQLFYTTMISFLTDEDRILAWKRVLLTKPSTNFLILARNKQPNGGKIGFKASTLYYEFFFFLFWLFKFHSILT